MSSPIKSPSLRLNTANISNQQTTNSNYYEVLKNCLLVSQHFNGKNPSIFFNLEPYQEKDVQVYSENDPSQKQQLRNYYRKPANQHLKLALRHSNGKEALLALRSGADTCFRLDYERTLLQWSIIHAHKEIFDFLSSHPCVDMGEYDWQKDTALHLAARTGQLYFVRILVTRCKDINAINFYGETPILKAADAGHYEVVVFLAEQGANLNDQNEFGYSPLLIAAENNHSEIAHYLIEKGADLNACQWEGLTVLDFAYQNMDRDLIDLLKQHKAKEGVYSKKKVSEIE